MRHKDKYIYIYVYIFEPEISNHGAWSLGWFTMCLKCDLYIGHDCHVCNQLPVQPKAFHFLLLTWPQYIYIYIYINIVLAATPCAASEHIRFVPIL